MTTHQIKTLNRSRPLVVGIVRGEGVGPELVDLSCDVLKAVAESSGVKIQFETDKQNGCDTTQVDHGLSEHLAGFCEEIFSAGGAVLAGAVGGRFVYDIRRRFELFYKLNPLLSYPELNGVCKIKLNGEPIDVMVVRENLLGIYQGNSVETESEQGREVRHTHVHKENQVRAVMKVAMEVARARRNAVSVISKAGGLPAIHGMWRTCALEAAETAGTEVAMLDVDYAAYKLVQEPESFDVILAPNCFGDILCDVGGVLAGSRGLTFGASYSAKGAAVYQTNHGAARDLAGKNIANPVGQIFSAAMMLRESFGLLMEAQLIEDAVREVWRSGWRTADLAEAGCRTAGTRQFTDLIVRNISGTRTCERDTRDTCSAVG